MKILGLPIPFTGEKRKALNSLPYGGQGGSYWPPIIYEPFTGAWQRNLSIQTDNASAFHADFACKTLISRDIAKLRVKLVEKDANGIWTETTNPAYSPVLRQPNDYQTRNQFWESWMLSKLSRGNTYVLKIRDNRNVIVALHVLDPLRVQPLVADDGSVFYRLNNDYLAGIGNITVPAREIIHDRFNCLFHPLVGTPPIFASGLASLLGLNAQRASALLFENNSSPGGIITAPGEVSADELSRIKEEWEQKHSRINLGRVAVLQGGATFQKVPLTAVETQMVDQLKWSAETVASVYHVPPYKVGIDVLPRGFTNLQALNIEYFCESLQGHIEEIEELLDDALGIGEETGLGTEFDTDNLLRLDSLALTSTVKDAVGAGVMSPNEGRAKFDLKPVMGGDSPYLQQQNYSLEALAKRDAQADPFAPATPATPPAVSQPQPDQQTQTPSTQEQPPQKLFDASQLTRKFTQALREAA